MGRCVCVWGGSPCRVVRFPASATARFGWLWRNPFSGNRISTRDFRLEISVVRNPFSVVKFVFSVVVVFFLGPKSVVYVVYVVVVCGVCVCVCALGVFFFFSCLALFFPCPFLPLKCSSVVVAVATFSSLCLCTDPPTPRLLPPELGLWL